MLSLYARPSRLARHRWLAAIAALALAQTAIADDHNAFFGGAMALVKTYSEQVLQTSSTCTTRAAGNDRIAVVSLPECRVRVRARFDPPDTRNNTRHSSTEIAERDAARLTSDR